MIKEIRIRGVALEKARTKIRRLMIAFLVIATTGSCAHPARLSVLSRDVLFVFAEGSTLFVVDPAAGRVSAAPSALPPQRTSPVLSSDSSTLYFTSEDSSAGGIFALDTRSLALRRIVARKRLGFRSEDSVKIFGYFLASAPSGGVLFDGSGFVRDRPGNFPESTQRIVSIDPSSGAVASASSSLSIMSLTPLPAGPVASKGGLIVLPLGFPRTRDSLGSIVLYDPASGKAYDSISIPKYRPGTEPSASKPYEPEMIRRMVASPDGRRLYILAWNNLYGFDLLTRRLFAVVHARSYSGLLAVSPNGNRVYFVEDKPGPMTPQLISRLPVARMVPPADPPSRIRVFDANLAEESPIPFGAQFSPDSPTTRPYSIEVSRDNTSIYITAEKANASGTRETHLLAMNATSGKILHDMPLGIRGGATILVGN